MVKLKVHDSLTWQNERLILKLDYFVKILKFFSVLVYVVKLKVQFKQQFKTF